MSNCCCLGFLRCLRSLETICSLACCARLLLVMFFASATLVLGALSEFSCTSKICLLCSSSQVILLGYDVHVCLACASLCPWVCCDVPLSSWQELLATRCVLTTRVLCKLCSCKCPWRLRSGVVRRVRSLALVPTVGLSFLLTIVGWFFLQRRIRATRSLCASSICKGV